MSMFLIQLLLLLLFLLILINDYIVLMCQIITVLNYCKKIIKKLFNGVYNKVKYSKIKWKKRAFFVL